MNLANFSAASQNDGIAVNWETVSERATLAWRDNLGFTLYRATDINGEQIKLNSDLIPAQAPGSGQGSAYEFVDQEIEAGQSYFYWLEDLDTNGNGTTHGPISATANMPTAVTLDGFSIDTATISLWGLVSLMLILLMGGWLLRGRVE